MLYPSLYLRLDIPPDIRKRFIRDMRLQGELKILAEGRLLPLREHNYGRTGPIRQEWIRLHM